VPGTDARTWYYLIRDLDPTARRYRALVFGVDDYDDEDRAFNTSDDIRVLHYAIARLRWSDTFGVHAIVRPTGRRDSRPERPAAQGHGLPQGRAGVSVEPEEAPGLCPLVRPPVGQHDLQLQGPGR